MPFHERPSDSYPDARGPAQKCNKRRKRRDFSAKRAMALFLDTFINKVDRKGRVSVPAPYRANLAGQAFHGLVAMPSFKHPAVYCAGMDFMETLIAETQKSQLFSDEHDHLTMTLFGDAKQLAFDGEGRILLPPVLAQHANITDTAAFVGRGRSFEIWEPRALEGYKAQARRHSFDQGGPPHPPGSPT
jgi:MraZ protein